MYLGLRQGKFMPALWTLCRFALHGGRTARTSESSAICYVKSKTTFWTGNDPPLTRTHLKPLWIRQPISKILKTFLKMFKQVKTEILTLETVRYYD